MEAGSDKVSGIVQKIKLFLQSSLYWNLEFGIRMEKIHGDAGRKYTADRNAFE